MIFNFFPHTFGNVSTQVSLGLVMANCSRHSKRFPILVDLLSCHKRETYMERKQSSCGNFRGWGKNARCNRVVRSLAWLAKEKQQRQASNCMCFCKLTFHWRMLQCSTSPQGVKSSAERGCEKLRKFAFFLLLPGASSLLQEQESPAHQITEHTV